MGSESELVAIAAHLHVLLRRKTGRVTDTEWLAANTEYAREILRFSREKAASEGHAELLPWADKLEAALQQRAAAPRRSLIDLAAEALRNAPSPPAEAERYVGRLR